MCGPDVTDFMTEAEGLMKFDHGPHLAPRLDFGQVCPKPYPNSNPTLLLLRLEAVAPGFWCSQVCVCICFLRLDLVCNRTLF